MRPRTDWSAEIALAFALVIGLGAFNIFKFPAQLAAARFSGAVIPNATHTHAYELDQFVAIHSIGGDRRVRGGTERGSALHVLVVPPAVKVTGVSRGGGLTNPGVVGKRLTVTYRVDEGPHAGAEVRVEAEYDAFRQTATLYGERYRLKKGNLFVVRLRDDLQPSVTQLDATVSEEQQDPRELLRVFRSAAREDPLVRGALDAILDPPARPRRGCSRAKAPAAAT